MHDIACVLFESLDINEQGCKIITRKSYNCHWEKLILKKNVLISTCKKRSFNQWKYLNKNFNKIDIYYLFRFF